MKLCKDCKHCVMVTYSERAVLMGRVFHKETADLLEGDTFALCARNVTDEQSPVDGELVSKGGYRDCEDERSPPHPFGRFCGKQGKYWEARE